MELPLSIVSLKSIKNITLPKALRLTITRKG